MPIALLSTKICHPPLQIRLIQRQQLLDRLNQAFYEGRKLTLISAPAGFGKTTLALSWISQLEQPIAWLALETGDNRPQRFWYYLLASLQTIEGLRFSGLMAELDSAAPLDYEVLLSQVVNDLSALPGRVVLVLDDLQVIESPVVYEILNGLLDHCPQQLHLVVLTRVDPRLDLAKRRARGEINEIRAAQLCFNQEEAGRFLTEAMNLHLTAQEISVLHHRTEGWAAGLQLAALAIGSLSEQGPLCQAQFIASFAGDDRYIVDYLLDEVLERQPGPIQDFLLKTSLLRRMNASLCEAVTGQANSWDILQTLERSNLFIQPIDPKRLWYRYHPLFADLLRNRLNYFAAQSEINQLHLRACHWLETNGRESDAIEHALAANEFALAAEFVERQALRSILRSETLITLEWLEALPKEIVCENPTLMVAHAWAVLLSMMPKEAVENCLRDVEAALHIETGDEQKKDFVQSQVLMIQSFLARIYDTDYTRAIQLAHEALDLIPAGFLAFHGVAWNNIGQAYMARKEIAAAKEAFRQAMRAGESGFGWYANLSSVFFLAFLQRCKGRLWDALDTCQTALQNSFSQSGAVTEPIPMIGAIEILMGSILREMNRLEEAKERLSRGIEQLRQTGEKRILVYGFANLALLEMALDHWARAEQILNEAERVWDQTIFFPQAVRARIALSRARKDPGVLAAAARWAEERGGIFDPASQLPAMNLLGQAQFFERMTLVRLVLASSKTCSQMIEPDPASLEAFLSNWQAQASALGWQEAVIETSLLQALLWQSRGEQKKAIAAARLALDTAHQQGYTRIFLDESQPMQQLLYRAADAGIQTGYAGSLVSAFQAAPSITRVRGKQGEPIEPLTKREIEVLELLARGLSNQEISRQLCISESTVKVHNRTIFGKLDVINRTQAVARGRDFGILSADG